VVDLELAGKVAWCAFSIIQILGTIAVMSQVAWEVFVIFIPVTAICMWYQVRDFFHLLYILEMITSYVGSMTREKTNLTSKAI
jgi:hypothetical protein